jgi:DNA invertase Pin-like site-specific DNA recombinase
MKTKAIGYVRVSTDKQADRGVSLEAQVEKIKAMATVHEVELLDVLVDAGESAKDLDRPGMVRILEMVQSRAVGMVIVAKLDRLTRSVKDLAVLLEQFQRRGVSLVSVAESLDTGSASGRLVLNIMVSVSQWEREAIGERTRDAMRHKKAKLEFVGNAPYGYRQAADKRHVEPEPGEQAILERIQAQEGRQISTEDRRAVEPDEDPDPSGFAVAARICRPAFEGGLRWTSTGSSRN